jgi:hypothetical protein
LLAGFPFQRGAIKVERMKNVISSLADSVMTRIAA